MDKRFKYLVSSLLSAAGFFYFISLPVESRYFGLMAGIVMSIFCFWFGLGIVFTNDFYTRMMSILLPSGFFVGFGMFVAMLPYSFLLSVVASAFFGLVYYVLFLVENVFLVAIGFKTVPLYRAAYTVSLIVLLMVSFFLFNSLYSFRLIYWANMLGVGIISLLLFMYQFWAVSIELPDDGKNKNKTDYVMVPSYITATMALALSFWPLGIFKSSVYLVSIIYILAGLIQADIKERLFKSVWVQFAWIGGGVVLAIMLTTGWK